MQRQESRPDRETRQNQSQAQTCTAVPANGPRWLTPAPPTHEISLAEGAPSRFVGPERLFVGLMGEHVDDRKARRGSDGWSLLRRPGRAGARGLLRRRG